MLVSHFSSIVSFAGNMELKINRTAINMGSYSDIVALNNTGVALLRNGDHQQALGKLTSALSCLGTVLVSDAAHIYTIEGNRTWLNPHFFSTWREVSNGLAAAMNTERAHAKLVFRSVAVADAAPIEKTAASCDPTASHNDYFTLYDSAFSVFEDWARNMSLLTWLALIPCILPAIFYNIGLIYHRTAIRYDSTGGLLQALDFYSASLFLLERHASAGLLKSQCNVLLLALYNNIGQIHSHFYNEAQTLFCRDQLISVFLQTDYTRFLTKEEFIFFDMNILFAVRRWPILAPAA
jgi:tetratricopeptide (TPR) repeat protein